MISIALDNKKTIQEIKVNSDYNYTLINVYCPYFSSKFSDLTLINPSVSIKYKILDRRKNVITKGNIIEKNDINSEKKLDDGHLKFNKRVLIDQKERNDYCYIEFEAVYANDEIFPVELIIESVEFNIPMNNPLLSFKEHLDQEQNSKILFSAPFGSGKTTFLKYFFQEQLSEYEAIHLFPVNYSVATNEDIFQYIKAEVLIQLMSKNVEFDKKSFEKKYTFPEFLKENIDDFLIPFFRLFPVVGGSIEGIVKDLIKVKKEYLEFHDKVQIDELDQAKKYIQKLYEKEGSIIEDNFFTQLIRQLNEQITINGKKTVLIIDDTDRMDPAHIFRILNIFAAHFDNRDNLADGYSNKLGFDKIIIVSDMNNLKFIFHHLYGKNTHFEGYINKFYSKSIFEFNNKVAIKNFINKEWGERRQPADSLFFILSDLQRTDTISLREILLIKKVTSGQPINIPHYISQRTHHFYSELKVMSDVFGFEQLLGKLERCSEMISIKERTPNYDYMSKQVLISLYFTFNLEEKDFTHTLKDYRIKFRLTEGIRRNLEFDSGSLLIDPAVPNFKFSPEDFYFLLINLANHYRKLFEPDWQ